MIVVQQARALWPPAALQLASGALGTVLALALLCPAVGAASLAALAEGRRYAGPLPAPVWRRAFAAVAVLAAASIAAPFFVPHTVYAWPMLAFAALGLAVNAASVVAAFPGRLSALHPYGVRASSAGYVALAGWGALALVRPEGRLCVAGVAVIGIVLAAERLLGRRTGR